MLSSLLNVAMRTYLMESHVLPAAHNRGLHTMSLTEHVVSAVTTLVLVLGACNYYLTIHGEKG